MEQSSVENDVENYNLFLVSYSPQGDRGRIKKNQMMYENIRAASAIPFARV